uniref:Uncharacterized protein n=1 Tax=Rhizophora mucronata TaxID=61149 RepID=A0A2P2PKH2_RHIMU
MLTYAYQHFLLGGGFQHLCFKQKKKGLIFDTLPVQ